jgi:hypothetical protein
VIKLTFFNFILKKRGFFLDMSYKENKYTNNKKNRQLNINLLIKYAKNITNLNFYGYST